MSKKKITLLFLCIILVTTNIYGIPCPDPLCQGGDEENKPPTIDLKWLPDKPYASEEIIFNSNASDPENDQLTYSWEIKKNNVTIDLGSQPTDQPTLKFTPLEPGEYKVFLSVSDGTNTTNNGTNGTKFTVFSSLSVSKILGKTSVTITVTEKTESYSVEVSGGATPLTYKWFLKKGSEQFVEQSNSNTKNFSFTFVEPGNYTLKVTVTDARGTKQEKTLDVTVSTTENKKPLTDFSFFPQNPFVEDQVTFTSHSSDDDGTITSYEWDFGDNSTGSGESVTHVFKNSGSYTVTLTVTDDKQAKNSASKTISVSRENEPSVSIEPQTPLQGETPLHVKLIAVTQNFVSPPSFEWSINQKKVGQQTNSFEHTFTEAGDYTVSVKASFTFNALTTNKSASIQVRVLKPEVSEKIFFVSPSDNAFFSNVSSLLVVVQAKNVSGVQLFADNKVVKKKFGQNPSFVVDLTPFGKNKFVLNLKAIALDTDGKPLINFNGEQVKQEISVTIDNSKLEEKVLPLKIVSKPKAIVSDNTVYFLFQTNKPAKARVFYWLADSNEKKELENLSLSNVFRLTATNLEKGGYFFKVKVFVESEETESEQGVFEVKTEASLEYPPGFKPSYCNIYCVSNSAFNSKNVPPKILGLSVSNNGSGEEGSSFVFSAKVYDPDNKDLQFVWDYGDGFSDIGFNLDTVKHSFFLPSNASEKSFVVKLFVSDLVSGQTKKVVSVNIKRAKEKILLLEPVTSSEVKIEKGQKIFFKIKIVDESNNALNPALIKNVSGVIAGKKFSFASFNKKSVFVGEIQSDLTFSSPVTYLKIEAEIQEGLSKRVLKTDFPVYFSPAEFSLKENPFKKQKLFLGEKIGQVKFSLKASNGLKPKQADLKALLISGNKKIERPVESLGDFFVVTIPTEVTEQDIEQGMVFRVTGKDSFGNKVKENSFVKIPVLRENPFFNVELLNPAKGTEKIAFGQNLKLKTKIFAKQDLSFSDVVVVATNLESGKSTELFFDMGERAYVGKMIAPPKSSGKKFFSLRVNAWLLSGKKRFRDFEDIDFELTDALNIDFVSPSNNFSLVSPRDNNKIVLSILYPDGSVFDKNSVVLDLNIDGKTFSADFSRTSKTNLFETQVFSLGNGNHEISVSMKGKYNGFKKISSFVLVLDLPFIVISFFVLLILFSVRVLLKDLLMTEEQKRALEMQRIEALAREREQVLTQLKELKLAFFKRKISEREYKEKALKAQQELETLNNKLGINQK